MRISVLLILSMIVVLLVAGFSGCSVGADQGIDRTKHVIATDINKSTAYTDVYGPYTDSSGQVEVTYYEIASSENQHNTVSVTVPDDTICIGGGASVEYNDVPAFITGSWPDEELTTWTAQSKDHVIPSFHVLRVTAVGLKLKENNKETYVPRNLLRWHMWPVPKCMDYTSDWPALSEWDEGPGDVIGTGAQVLDPFSNWGNLLTASWGAWNSSCASSKAHYATDPKYLMTYSIRFDNNYIDEFGYLEINNYNPSTFDTNAFARRKMTSVAGEQARIACLPSDGWVISCVGANTYGTYMPTLDYGRMLTGLSYLKMTTMPVVSAIASDSDLIYRSTGTLELYFTQIRKKP